MAGAPEAAQSILTTLDDIAATNRALRIRSEEKAESLRRWEEERAQAKKAQEFRENLQIMDSLLTGWNSAQSNADKDWYLKSYTSLKGSLDPRLRVIAENHFAATPFGAREQRKRNFIQSVGERPANTFDPKEQTQAYFSMEYQGEVYDARLQQAMTGGEYHAPLKKKLSTIAGITYIRSVDDRGYVSAVEFGEKAQLQQAEKYGVSVADVVQGKKVQQYTGSLGTAEGFVDNIVHTNVATDEVTIEHRPAMSGGRRAFGPSTAQETEDRKKTVAALPEGVNRFRQAVANDGMYLDKNGEEVEDSTYKLIKQRAEQILAIQKEKGVDITKDKKLPSALKKEIESILGQQYPGYTFYADGDLTVEDGWFTSPTIATGKLFDVVPIPGEKEPFATMDGKIVYFPWEPNTNTVRDKWGNVLPGGSREAVAERIGSMTYEELYGKKGEKKPRQSLLKLQSEALRLKLGRK